MAADGEACKTMNTGRPSHSALGERPMTMPASTPPRPVSSTPTTSAGIVWAYAFRNVPSVSISTKAAIVWLKLGFEQADPGFRDPLEIFDVRWNAGVIARLWREAP